MIEFNDVTFTYDKDLDNAIENINFTIAKGEFVAIIGNNGAGKTTLVKHINGLLKPNTGSVLICGEDIKKTPLSKMATLVGLAFQNPIHQLFAETVKKELELGPKNLGISEEEREEISKKIAEQLHIVHLLDRSPLELSGGEQRLASIASVLTMNQQILVLDEPSYGQDYNQKKRLGGFLKEISESGITVVIVSHDINFVQEFADRIIVLVDGKIIADGEKTEILTKKEIYEKTDLLQPIFLELTLALKEIDSSFSVGFNELELLEILFEKIKTK
ncbi:MAG: energy-coupling factor ABC transporter ATP-binding protein [Candidatus Heimdallarchaeota archaeon]